MTDVLDLESELAVARVLGRMSLKDALDPVLPMGMTREIYSDELRGGWVVWLRMAGMARDFFISDADMADNEMIGKMLAACFTECTSVDELNQTLALDALINAGLATEEEIETEDGARLLCLSAGGYVLWHPDEGLKAMTKSEARRLHASLAERQLEEGIWARCDIQLFHVEQT